MICVLVGLNSFLYYFCFAVSRWSRPHWHSCGSADSCHGWHYWFGPLQSRKHLHCRWGWNTCEWSHKSGWVISPALWVHLCTRPTIPKETWAYIHIYPEGCDVPWGQQTTERASTDAEEWFVQWVNHSEWTTCWAEYWGSFFLFVFFLIIWLFYFKFKVNNCSFCVLFMFNVVLPNTLMHYLMFVPSYVQLYKPVQIWMPHFSCFLGSSVH